MRSADAYEAPVRRLDDVIADEPDLTDAGDVLALKIDVEGLEAQVLFGAEALLRRCTPLVMLEGGNRHANVSKYMTGLGYHYYERDDGTLHGVATIGNAINGFFVHQDRVDTLVAAGWIASAPPPAAPDSDVRDKASELAPAYIEGKTGQHFDTCDWSLKHEHNDSSRQVEASSNLVCGRGTLDIGGVR